MRSARQLVQYRQSSFPPPLNKNILSCSSHVRDELLAALEYTSEIKDVGEHLLLSKGHPDPGASFLRLQAYIRQAKTFYEAADKLHHRASPLLYYYAFLNFAKSLLFLRNPLFATGRVHHGLSPRAGRGIHDHAVSTGNGVFKSLYEEITNRTLAPSVFNIRDLFGYLKDVSFEYAKMEIGLRRFFACKLIVSIHQMPGESSSILVAVYGANAPNFDPNRLNLLDQFEEVSVTPYVCQEVFEMKAEERATCKFFETKAMCTTPDWGDFFSNALASLGNTVAYEPFDNGYLFTLNLPAETPTPVPMNEFLALYASMFFLGSLVRYQPEVLEAMLSTKDAWLVERMIKSAPLAFLRYFQNYFDEQYVVYTFKN